jgi:hypothetical protein
MGKNSSHTSHLLGISCDALFALQQRLRPAGDEKQHLLANLVTQTGFALLMASLSQSRT